MPEIYWLGDLGTEPEAETTTNDALACMFAPDVIRPLGGVVALDTETRGLYVDGDWQDAPPARVSTVSLAWLEQPVCSCHETGAPCVCEPQIVAVAIPFDQGKRRGKPGRWLAAEHGYEFMTVDIDQQDEFYRVNAEPNVWVALGQWLADKRVVMHHGKFDSHIMQAGLADDLVNPGLSRFNVPGHWPIDLLPRWVHDTMLTQGVLNPLETSSLKPTAERLWGLNTRDYEAAVKAALKKNGVGLTWRYDLLAWDVLGPYAAMDAVLTLKLWAAQVSGINEGLVEHTDLAIIEQEYELAKLLLKIERRGVGFDAEGMANAATGLEFLKGQIEARLPFSPPNVNAAKRHFYGPESEGGLGLIPMKTTPKGAPSLDAEAAAALAKKGVEGAQDWVDLADINSALAKWFRAWPAKVGPDGRLRTNFRQGRIESDRRGMTSGGAISGRLSAERIQLQGVPREQTLNGAVPSVKGFIKAKPEHVVIEIDASNAEIRVAAWASQCAALIERINSGENIHDSNTMAIFGVTKDDPQWEKFRGLAKIGVFSELYGSGVRTMTAQFRAGLKDQTLKESVARDFKASMVAAYPELKRASKAAERKADRHMGNGYVRLVNGRKRVFGWAEHTYKAFNAVIQGGVAESMKRFMLMVEATYPGMMINQVHDSVWLEVPEAQVDEVISEVTAMGASLFESIFDTADHHIMWKFDAKVIGAK